MKRHYHNAVFGTKTNSYTRVGQLWWHCTLACLAYQGYKLEDELTQSYGETCAD